MNRISIIAIACLLLAGIKTHSAIPTNADIKFRVKKKDALVKNGCTVAKIKCTRQLAAVKKVEGAMLQLEFPEKLDRPFTQTRPEMRPF